MIGPDPPFLQKLFFVRFECLRAHFELVLRTEYENHLAQLSNRQDAPDHVDEEWKCDIGLPHERERRVGDVVEYAVDVIADMYPADGQWNTASRGVLTGLFKRRVGHREHAGDADKIGREVLY